MIRIKRVYEPRARGDGRRILVERLWPRGIKKETLEAEWVKDVAPSTKLRKWFAHRVERWSEFVRRYEEELDSNVAAWAPLVRSADKKSVTLLYSAHDVEHNSAIVLRDYLTAQSRRAKSATRSAVTRK